MALTEGLDETEVLPEELPWAEALAATPECRQLLSEIIAGRLRTLDDTNPDPILAEVEQRVVEKANKSGIGPMGFGGKTTVLATKIKGMHRLPASFFVTVSYMCWANRHRKMTVRGEEVKYE